MKIIRGYGERESGGGRSSGGEKWIGCSSGITSGSNGESISSWYIRVISMEQKWS